MKTQKAKMKGNEYPKKFKMKEMKAQKASLVRNKEEKVRPKKNHVASA